MTSSISDAIAVEARAQGFATVGIMSADRAPDLRERLRRWIDAGMAGDMLWMESTQDRRHSPQALWPDVRSVIMLGFPYTPPVDPLRHRDHPDTGVISTYAMGVDYHDLVKRRLKALARFIVEKAGGELKVFVDTAPVMEKPLAAAAGIGWQGKHSNLLSRKHGNWLFIGAIYSALDLPEITDTGSQADCGSCTLCISACPTGAIVAPYQVDARRCISYLTIEHKGPIPLEFRTLIGNRIYGCDDCLAVCPWNRFAHLPPEPPLLPRGELLAPRIADLLALDDESFRKLFRGSPVKRVGRDRFIRNCLIAAGNSADRALVPVVSGLLDDPSELVRESARWALDQLGC